MSLLHPSRQDIENWVPEPAPSCGGAGLVAKLFEATGKVLASMTTIFRTAEDGIGSRCGNELERFFLWGQGLSVADGELDEALAFSKELYFRVLSLLLRLGTAILQCLYLKTPLPSRVVIEQCWGLRTLLETAEAVLQESNPDQPIRPSTPAESEISDYGVLEIMEEISIYVDCLLDLSPSLDNPAMDVQVEGPDERAGKASESFNVRSEEALIYCRKIRDRFEALPKYLVERLAEANARRAAALREMRSRYPKSDIVDTAESLLSTTDQRKTETTRSTTMASSLIPSIFDSSSLSGQLPLQVDDTVSEATFASFSTGKSTGDIGRPRVPPMPEMLETGFDCPICFLPVTNVRNTREWKKHVFNDLKPYLCTIEGCKDAEALYSLTRKWAQHEASHVSLTLTSSECQFCSATYTTRGPAYFNHVSAHLREVSLSVLPKVVDGDDDGDGGGFDNEDSDAPLPMPDFRELEEEGPESRKNTRTVKHQEETIAVRKIRACYLCRLSKTRCDPSAICQPCRKRLVPESVCVRKPLLGMVSSVSARWNFYPSSFIPGRDQFTDPRRFRLFVSCSDHIDSPLLEVEARPFALPNQTDQDTRSMPWLGIIPDKGPPEATIYRWMAQQILAEDRVDFEAEMDRLLLAFVGRREIQTAPEIAPIPETQSAPEIASLPETQRAPEIAPLPETQSAPEIAPLPESLMSNILKMKCMWKLWTCEQLFSRPQPGSSATRLNLRFVPIQDSLRVFAAERISELERTIISDIEKYFLNKNEAVRLTAETRSIFDIANWLILWQMILIYRQSLNWTMEQRQTNAVPIPVAVMPMNERRRAFREATKRLLEATIVVYSGTFYKKTTVKRIESAGLLDFGGDQNLNVKYQSVLKALPDFYQQVLRQVLPADKLFIECIVKKEASIITRSRAE